jgi:poly(3-hydroxybutyrate) depolymerase
MRPCRRALLLLGLLVLPLARGSADGVVQERIEFAGSDRSFHVFVPAGLPAEAPAPVLLLLHGSHQTGRQLLEHWTALAQREGLLLIAPDSIEPVGWQMKSDGPAFIHAVVDAVARGRPVHRRRLYLFGISGGAVYALTLAVLESEYFAAAAIFAGAWREDSFYLLLPHARRRIPIAIFVGTRDPYFPMNTVRKTVAGFEAAGHPVLLQQLKGRGHAYTPVSDEVNSGAWNFLKQVQLAFDAQTHPGSAVRVGTSPVLPSR